MLPGRNVNDSQLAVVPLHLLHYIQAAVEDELVHVPVLLGEMRLAVTALFRCAEFILEDRIILCANDGKVVRHRLLSVHYLDVLD